MKGMSMAVDCSTPSALGASKLGRLKSDKTTSQVWEWSESSICSLVSTRTY